jgi:hypothetical protein
MKRSIFYTGLISVVAFGSVTTETAFAVTGNASDNIAPPIIIPVIPTWPTYVNVTPQEQTVPPVVIQPTPVNPSPEPAPQESESMLKGKKKKVGDPRH